MSESIEYLNALAAFNLLDKTTETEDGELLLILKSAHVKLNSIDEVVKVCKDIHSKLGSRSTQALRGWISIIRGMHPSVWEEIKDLDYFKGVSEEVGERTLGYTQDTQSLQLEDWKDAKPIRKTILSKIDDSALSMIENSYSKINEAMSKGLPGQFYNKDEKRFYRGLLTYNSIYIQLKAHDYYVAGDVFYKFILDEALNDIETSIKEVLGDSIRLIQHITPINISVSIDNDILSITPENKSVNVNMKSDRVESPIAEINNEVLMP